MREHFIFSLSGDPQDLRTLLNAFLENPNPGRIYSFQPRRSLNGYVVLISETEQERKKRLEDEKYCVQVNFRVAPDPEKCIKELKDETEAGERAKEESPDQEDPPF